MREKLKKNYFTIIIVILSYIFIPEVRIYAAFATIIYVIYLNSSNGIVLYFIYNAIASFLSVLMSALAESGDFYIVIETMSRMLFFGTMTSIIDQIYYNWSASWSGLIHFYVMIGFLLAAFIVHKQKILFAHSKKRIR